MSSNGYAKPDDLFNQHKVRRYTDVEVGGRQFCLQSWTYLDMQEFNDREFSASGDANLHLIVGTCVDENKKPLFSVEDITKLRHLDAGFVTALVEACLNHAGLGDSEPEKN